MNLKKIAKKSFVDFFTLPLAFLSWALEKAGLRCRKCGAWGRRKSCFGSAIEELAPYQKRWYRKRVYYCRNCSCVSKAIKVYIPDYVEGMP